MKSHDPRRRLKQAPFATAFAAFGMVYCFSITNGFAQSTVVVDTPDASASAPHPAVLASDSGAAVPPLRVQVIKDPEQEETASLADEIKSGATLRHGISIGAAFQAEFGTQSTSEGATPGVGGAALFYIAIFPGYWGLGTENRLFCSSARGDAQDLADKSAHRRARELDSTISPEYKACSEDEACRKKVRAAVHWAFGVPARCAATRWGLFAGYPASVTQMNVRLTDTERARDVQGLVSGGFVFSPTYFIQFLAGVTVLQAQRDGDGTHNGVAVPIVVPSLAVGSTIDIISAFK